SRPSCRCAFSATHPISPLSLHDALPILPITTLVIGEGGSGGALAVCSTDRLWITPDAYFSVIAPEMAAAILKQPQQDVPDLAHMLKLRPTDLLRLGVVDGIAGR